jgi:hypothetical protein
MKSINLVNFKNSILVSLIALLCISIVSTNLATTFGTPLKVIINEIELNPPGTDYGNEWLELYNPTSSSIDLSGWKIYTSGGRVYKIPDYTIIAPNSYIVVSFKMIFLNNENEYVILKDSTGAIVDQSPTISDVANNEYTWQRYPNSKDTDTSGDWQFRPMTKGSNNGGESISLSISSTSITLGSSVSIHGSISPAHFAFITIQYLHGGSWTNLATITTSDGNFATDWVPPEVGSYSLRALLWDGVTSNTVELTVNKISTSLSCMASSPKISLKKSISILGFISPKFSIPLTLTLNAPNGSALVRSITTDSNGFFNYTFIPDATGVWNARVSWDGNEAYSGSTSDLTYFEVGPYSADTGMAMIFLPLALIPGVLALALLFGKAKPSAPPTPPVHPKGMAKPQPIKLVKPKKPLLSLRKPRFLQKPRLPVCPTCRGQLIFIQQRRRWYCPNCRKYL